MESVVRLKKNKTGSGNGVVYFRPTIRDETGTVAVLFTNGSVPTIAPWFHYTDLLEADTSAPFTIRTRWIGKSRDQTRE